jgi:hypothetical protein
MIYRHIYIRGNIPAFRQIRRVEIEGDSYVRDQTCI